MARDTGTGENASYNREMAAIQQETNARNRTAVNKYNTQLDTISKGGKIGVNPFEDSGYLQNQNLISAASTGAVNAGTKELLQSEASRTGSNTTSRKATIADLGRNRMRTQTDYNAGRVADDYGRGLDWQKFLLGSTLAPTGVDTAMFQGATSGRNTATKNLTDIGIADKQAFSQMVSAGITAGGSAATAFCPAAGSNIDTPEGLKAVEFLKAGDAISQLGGGTAVLAETPVPVMATLALTKTRNGHGGKTSTSHSYSTPDGGYVIVNEIQGGVAIRTRDGEDVASSEDAGDGLVYPIKTVGGNKTYCADGIWSLE